KTRSEILLEEGMEKGREEGILGAIDIMLEMNCSESDITAKLVKTYNLTKEEAKALYDECVTQTV
ncbi:MAG: hypothetical protein IKZ94_08940, partial [Lachnospiraceae bacterium]|nr:hypothetical protein [Lachnospiraceae bacterium]